MPQVAKIEAQVCDRCGSRVSASAKFCQNCGEDMRDPKSLKTRTRFLWLGNMEKRYASDRTLFRISGTSNAEDENEGPMLDKAKKRAKEANQPVTVNVVLIEKRGEIDSFPWAVVGPSGTVEYVFP